MARPHPTQNVSFDDVIPPSRRAGRQQDDQPPRPPAKSGLSKTSFQTSSSGPPMADPVQYEAGYVDAGSSNPQGFSASNGADVRRKKSMVRPERERIDPGHRLWHYREHAADDNLDVMPSTTGNQPVHLRRGKSLLGRDSDQEQGGIFRRGTLRGTLRRRKSQANRPPNAVQTNKIDTPHGEANCCPCLGDFVPGPKDAWMVYCYFLTICIPNWALKSCAGKRTPEAQRAWREKCGLVSIVAILMGAVGFLTFGFTQTVCGVQPLKIKGGEVRSDSVVINGMDYDLGRYEHPAVDGIFNGTQNPLYMDQYMAGGKDLSFLFQRVNQNCLDVVTPADNSGIRHDGNRLAWYFPCNIHSQYGTSASAPVNLTGITEPTNCHTSEAARNDFNSRTPTAEVYYTWDQVRNESRSLAVYKSIVLDMSLIDWLDDTQLNYPSFFNTMKGRNATFAGQDITALVERAGYNRYVECLTDIIQVGYVDSTSIGCVASDIVLYLSLVFILGAVSIKFFMALYFGWFMSWKLGNFKNVSYAERIRRAHEVEAWSEDIYRAAPANMRPNARGGNRKTVFLPTTSRFSKAEPMLVNSRPQTAYSMVDGPKRGGGQASMYGSRLTPGGLHGSPPDSPMLRNSRSSTSLPFRDESGYSLSDQSHNPNPYNCPFPLGNVVPQPSPDFKPFGYELVHSICLVTAYSESYAGLRTTLDSLATTDYPNSHKLLLVVCDGIVRGSDSKTNESTHEIVLSMMKEFVTDPEDAEKYSCLAIADGGKRENKAIVYAGFYNYDNDTVEEGKQQRVPMVLVAKVGNDDEMRQYQQAGRGKPGNRGKRDSQIILMSFLQKVMFDERMTQFEYEFFNAVWRVTGVPPDKYETVLCVDADTKVFPDSLTRMNACLVHDPDIMGLCGETKIANKKESWVTMIQVFEYYISHHLSKAFESVFGGVTCLPGCFSIYRIKAPKGQAGYWVPILANPDIVEHYSENVVDTLHKKNLLLLGEDRYLSTLMLKTFPKRKMMFCPQAVCKTQVPERFRILLSQRRRWINSTVHNLFELMLVRDLCGTFCFSMQFVVFMDLVGTLVLPAAISFTLYIIVVSIIPSSVTGIERPIISLILLALILGLPGVLIVVTTRKIAYVGWMLLYLLSLPIWNLVLPAYSYWHMDDFTWGETRKIQGETKEVAHGDKEGKFDPANIVMKRWQEFERERRWKSGTASRDSGIYDRAGSPKNAFASHRYSLASTNETYQSGAFGVADGNPFRQSQSFASMSQYAGADPSSSSQLVAPASRSYPRDQSPNSSTESGQSYPRALDRLPSDDPSYYSGNTEFPSHLYSPGSNENAPILPADPAHIAPGHYSSSSQAMYAENDHQTRTRQPSGRGVSLVDTGPVANEPVRRTSKHQRRSSSRQYLASPISSSSTHHPGNLPPGAAPPSHHQ